MVTAEPPQVTHNYTDPGGVTWVKPDRQAEALAVVTTMREDLHAAHSMIEQLKADLHICRENTSRIDEERRRYRAEALVFRSKLIQLATTLANVHLATQQAAEIIKTVEDLTTNAETPTTEVLASMEKTLIPDNSFEARPTSEANTERRKAIMETLSGRTPVDPT